MNCQGIGTAIDHKVRVEVIPYLFDLSYSRNPGGLFGFFSDIASPWRILLLTLLPIRHST